MTRSRWTPRSRRCSSSAARAVNRSDRQNQKASRARLTLLGKETALFVKGKKTYPLAEEQSWALVSTPFEHFAEYFLSLSLSLSLSLEQEYV